MDHPLRHHIARIAELTDEQFDFAFSHFTNRKLRKHQYLVQPDELVNHDFFVLKGCLKAYHTNAEGKVHILQFATEDWWITDYRAYYNRVPATICVDCIEDSELLCISYEAREKLCAALHPMEHFFRKKSNTGYAALLQRVLCLLQGDAQERFHEFSRLYPKLLQRVPKQLIAAYLGLSRETLSRLDQRKVV